MSNKLIKTFDQYVTSQKIAIAVSGGIDSMVLMKVSSLSKKIKPENIHILTINHDLRKGSKEETLFVRKEADKLGLKATVLTWKGKKPKSGIQEKARKKRQNLLFNYCKKK